MATQYEFLTAAEAMQASSQKHAWAAKSIRFPVSAKQQEDQRSSVSLQSNLWRISEAKENIWAF